MTEWFTTAFITVRAQLWTEAHLRRDFLWTFEKIVSKCPNTGNLEAFFAVSQVKTLFLGMVFGRKQIYWFIQLILKRLHNETIKSTSLNLNVLKCVIIFDSHYFRLVSENWTINLTQPRFASIFWKTITFLSPQRFRMPSPNYNPVMFRRIGRRYIIYK